jgi:uncharacterized membrane protein HdeD (DUF308 family)
MQLFKLLLFVLIVGVVMLAARGWFGARLTRRSNLWGGSALVLTVVGVLLLFTPLKGLAVLALVAALPLAIVGALVRREEPPSRERGGM